MRWDNPEVVERDFLRPWAEYVPIGISHTREVEHVEYDPKTGKGTVKLKITIPENTKHITLPIQLELDPEGGPPLLFPPEE